ncbi:DUF4097 family beta strand repeat-containing protein [Seonamhaeicola marinus]|uniref:DUF4097 domain-containing protein n=1 Tax=Seonamhaeicola marinus TaxID=1912246 RepID=A0A5D0HTY9_9FLAO|nr:DUF4097 family beta strand repeat-containing protein [Seonamhaeicola marinus]TYA74824.1 DUF4097 domain-containing protein [Seonamhaeicola marinus]
MKRTGIIINFIALLCVVLSYGQESGYTKNLQGITKVYIETGTKVAIVASNNNELKIENQNTKAYKSDGDKTERAKGLKAVYPGGVDETGYGFAVYKEGNVLRVRDLKSWMQRKGLKIELPKTVDIHIDCGELGAATFKGFTSEIEVNTNVGNITLKEVTGPVTAHTQTGTIEVDFVSVNQSSPITLNSATGVIDVSLPSGTKADLNLRSTMGTIYTDFDLQMKAPDGMKVVGANRKIETEINGGGVAIVLRSSTGNVYLRKK